MAKKYSVIVLALVLCLFGFSNAAVVNTGEIYSVDWLGAEDGTLQTLDVNTEDGISVTVAEFNNNLAAQRFVGRLNDDNTFNLFLEVQPWDWVAYIDEKSHTVNINDKKPRVLTAVGGTTRALQQADYTGSDNQKWYLVPTGADSDKGLITNLSLRLCIVNNGPGVNVTIATCSLTDPNQEFRFTRRNQGRCY